MTDDFARDDPTDHPNRRRFLAALGALGVAGLAGCGGDGDSTASPTDTATATDTVATTSTDTTTGTETTAGTTTTGGGTPTDTVTDTPTPTVPPEQRPPTVTPSGIDVGAAPPDDAEVLFGGDVDTLEKWTGDWIVADDGSYFEIDVGSGDIQTQEPHGDCHLHIEFSPDASTGSGQSQGNSGVFMENRYEFQVLNNYENDTYSQGMAGAYYAQSPPLVDPARPPEEWQAYDIIWRGPRFEGGEVVHPGKAVQIFNGVVTQVHLNVAGPTTASLNPYQPHDRGGPLGLQDHGDSANRYRNVWYRPLPEPERQPSFRPDYDDDYQQTAYHPWPPEYPGVTSEAEGVTPVDAIDPGTWPDDPPGDATVLLSGGDLSNWEGPDGGSPGWTEEDGYVAVDPDAGNIRTAETFGDGQYHVEWRIPEDIDGPGNSGVLFANRYGIQIRDNHERVSRPTHWAGAYTDQGAPLANAVRSPGEWQTFDVVWEGPRFGDDDTLERPARVTVLLNGVVVQDRFYPKGPNRDDSAVVYTPHDPNAPLGLQGSDDPVHFRNVWYRPWYQ